jgi:hypothetical protein
VKDFWRNQMGIVTHGTMKNLISGEFVFEAEIGVLEKDARVAKAWVADSKLVERSPACGRGGRIGGVRDEIRDDWRNGGGALVAPAYVADQGREL